MMIINSNKNKKVVIGLSGGIDSAISAHLLISEGYHVEAVFMKNWDDLAFGNLNKDKYECSQEKDFKSAKEVANFLGIKITEASFMKEYYKKVFSKFIFSIKEGRVTNPDIVCNKVIKFHYFFEFAKKIMKADMVATGHYASIKKIGEDYFVFEAKDKNKDQTYFLCQIPRENIPYLMFPISNMYKTEVREKAINISLPNMNAKESMGICFVGENNFEKFISNYIEEEEIDIIKLNSDGSESKIHNYRGPNYFTIGQRKGLNLGGNKFPFYVVGKDIKRRKVFVVEKWDNELLYSKWCIIKNINWLIKENHINDLTSKNLKFKSRHGQEKQDIKKIEFLKNKNEIKVYFEDPTRAITPGQYIVLYHSERCLGGGIIWESEKNSYKSNIRKINKT